jgi:N6-L-threonylcarbamoyladenine synthase
MINHPGYDFSFSGLKTAVLYQHRSYSDQLKRSPFYKLKMAAEIEDAINDVLIKKTINAASQYQAKTILIGGGVAANKSLRRRLATEAFSNNFKFFAPSVTLSTDNAAMIALTGLKYLKKASLSDTIKVNANLNL